jgi:hypothetical protein
MCQLLLQLLLSSSHLFCQHLHTCLLQFRQLGLSLLQLQPGLCLCLLLLCLLQLYLLLQSVHLQGQLLQ